MDDALSFEGQLKDLKEEMEKAEKGKAMHVSGNPVSPGQVEVAKKNIETLAKMSKGKPGEKLWMRVLPKIGVEKKGVGVLG